MSIQCVIVDDEPIAAKGIAGYAEKISSLEVVAVLHSAIDLNEFLQEREVDLVFLDIEMPYLTGLSWLKAFKNPPKVIFTTAYDKYALEGFDLDVMDYLLKPVSFERFLKAVNKVKEHFKSEEDHIFIKTDGRLEKLPFDQIICVEGMQNYVTFLTEDKRLISHLTLKSVEEQLPTGMFIKCHKSYLINISAVVSIEGLRITTSNGLKIPIGKSQKDQVLNKITKNILKK
ncbi:MAG: LytTR family DNA-binding domain-containing protein [Marinoscillum sp.]